MWGTPIDGVKATERPSYRGKYGRTPAASCTRRRRQTRRDTRRTAARRSRRRGSPRTASATTQNRRQSLLTATTSPVFPLQCRHCLHRRRCRRFCRRRHRRALCCSRTTQVLRHSQCRGPAAACGLRHPPLRTAHRSTLVTPSGAPHLR